MTKRKEVREVEPGGAAKDMPFGVFGAAVAKQFSIMNETGRLFRADVSKDALWETYLSAWPAGSNLIYKTRPEHDCQACRQFIRAVGSVISIAPDGKVSTIWDWPLEGAYGEVSAAMAALVRTAAIDNVFLTGERTAGQGKTRQLLPDNTVQNWEHFFVNIPSIAVVNKDALGTKEAECRSTHDVLKRGLEELTLDAIDTVLELIAQNSLYRGAESLGVLTEFRKLKVQFDAVASFKNAQDRFFWLTSVAASEAVTRIRNTAIGTLLVDLSNGVEMEAAVRSFESKVAPLNYRRPTALVTKGMIAKAEADLSAAGLLSALERRYATIEDITINNILFADRASRKVLSPFGLLAAEVPESKKSLDKVEEISIEDFITNVLPKADSLELLLENRHAANLVSLIAPSDATAKPLFKWDNKFSWSYAGEVTDSIKERVKAAGGSITGYLRCSLSWFNYDDLDLHMVEVPAGRFGAYEIYFGNKGQKSPSGGVLDVDMNVSPTTREAVENIVYDSLNGMHVGRYTLSVRNYNRRENKDVGFDVEVEFEGTTLVFHRAGIVLNGQTVKVVEFEVLPATKTEPKRLVLLTKEQEVRAQKSKQVWGVQTETFQKVNVVMLSPNYWDDNNTGNKHYFFMLEGCRNEEKARGFFNEFLRQDLDKHRKVLEMVGAKMKTDLSERQLSGVGFSSTVRNSALVRVKGSFTRMLKINF